MIIKIVLFMLISLNIFALSNIPNFLMIDKKIDWNNARNICKNKQMTLPTLKYFKNISKDEYRANKRYWTITDGYSNERYVYGYGFSMDEDLYNKEDKAYVLCIKK